MQISRITNLFNVFVLCFIIIFCLIMYQLSSAIHGYMDLESRKYTSLDLAVELRNSSRLLTENFRLYIMTGDQKFENAYWNIVDERSGIIPRSLDKKVAPGKTVKLEELLQNNIFFQDQIPIIKKANRLSDNLIQFETHAMNMVKGTQDTPADPKKAKELAYSPEYISSTHDIMTLLDIFYDDVNNIVKANTQEFENKITYYLALALIIFIIFTIIIVMIRVYTYIYVYTPINKITQFANTIINGDITKRINNNINNEIGKLCFTLNLMLDKLENEIVTSSTDPLTHLCNRRFFEKKLENFKLSYEYKSQIFSILMLDIDFFKSVNDRFGHICGDDVLRCFAEKMRSCCRRDDIVARLGGEEFAILLPMPAPGAAILAERVRATIENTKMLPDGSVVTCSIGVAQYAPGEKMEEFLDRADQALYRAKREGRNRVCISEKDIPKKLE